MKKTVNSTEIDLNSRIDLVLARMFPEYSRSRLQLWLKENKVRVNGRILTRKEKLSGDEIIEIPNEKTGEFPDQWQAENITIDIVYKDHDIIVINKPAGLVVHPGAGNRHGTLVNGLLYHDETLANIPRAGLIHRIDKDTSGLLLIARNLSAHNFLTGQMEQRLISRKYLAVVHGSLISGGTINQPLGRDKTNRLKMAVRADGRQAVTHYRIKRRFKYYTLLEISLETGRTHQIRVHMAFIKHPLAGDKIYCNRAFQQSKGADEPIKRQALHAHKLEFAGMNGKTMSFSTPLPADMTEFIEHLEHDNS